MERIKIKVIIPTYNAGVGFKNMLRLLLQQDGVTPQDFLVVDSSSTDDTPQLVKEAGIQLITIPKKEFGHGKTRKFACEQAGDIDLAVFMTQDARPYNTTSIKKLCSYVLVHDNMAAAYGRQVSYEETDSFGKFARLNNYQDTSYIRTFADRKQYGIKTAFFSDTFAVYKKDILEKMGGFDDVNFGEDTCMVAKMLMQGYKIGYCAEAMVYHSHTFTILEEFKRYQEIGKFHKEQHWLLDNFGKAESEGLKFVEKEIHYLLKSGKWYLVPESFARNTAKFLGYKIHN